MALGGAFLRIGAIVLRAIEFGASVVSLGIFSYFLAVLSDHKLPIANWKRGVEGISGAAVLYTIFGVIFTLCLGGNTFFGLVAIILDVCFAICFIAVAVMTRHGAGSCSGYVYTPLGDGPSNTQADGYGSNGFGFGGDQNVTYSPNLYTACRLNTAVFAVAIINIFLFLITAAYQVMLVRHHKKEKANGTAPTTKSYLMSGRKNKTGTTGGHRGFFWNKNKKAYNTHDAEAATAMPVQHHNYQEPVVRQSGETGTTVGNTQYTTEPKFGQPGYGQTHY